MAVGPGTLNFLYSCKCRNTPDNEHSCVEWCVCVCLHVLLFVRSHLFKVRNGGALSSIVRIFVNVKNFFPTLRHQTGDDTFLRQRGKLLVSGSNAVRTGVALKSNR